jgi:hypothetical protein
MLPVINMKRPRPLVPQLQTGHQDITVTSPNGAVVTTGNNTTTSTESAARPGNTAPGTRPRSSRKQQHQCRPALVPTASWIGGASNARTGIADIRQWYRGIADSAIDLGHQPKMYMKTKHLRAGRRITCRRSGNLSYIGMERQT